ncbi:MAG: 50S ribosomal protein L10 [archaeon]|nr:50S ribosomal protein L10 [archaeon]
MPRKTQQVLAEQKKRTSYPPKKLEMLQHIEELAKKYDTVIVSKLHKVRAGQLMLLRKNFRQQLVMVVAKNQIAALGLKKANLKNADQFVSNLTGQNALIFTNMNPFNLYLSLEKSKVTLPARAGDIATSDIVIPSGSTGIPPGPVLSEFKEAGVQTRIEAGSIYVSRDSVVAHLGDVISPKLAGLLSRLNIKPIKAGLSIFMASAEGLLLLQKDIAIDLEQYRSDVTTAAKEALGLALEAAYVTPESLPLLFGRALRQAKRVASESGYLTAETSNDVFGLAEAQARAVLDAAKRRGYSES